MVFRSRAKLFERRKSLVKLTMKVLTRDGKIKEFEEREKMPTSKLNSNFVPENSSCTRKEVALYSKQ